MKMDAAEAARVIRPHFDELSSQLSPEDRHRAKFVVDVCAALGVEPNLENGAKVARALEKLGAEPHVVQEYPKWVNHPTEKDEDGNPALVLVYSEDDEKKLASGEQKPEEKTAEQKLEEERVKLETEHAKLEAEQVKAEKEAKSVGFQSAGAGKLEPASTEPRRPPPQVPGRRTP